MSQSEDSNNDYGTAGLVGALLLGLAAGAVLGIVLAPAKGIETRQKICDRLENLGKDLCSQETAKSSENEDPESDRPV